MKGLGKRKRSVGAQQVFALDLNFAVLHFGAGVHWASARIRQQAPELTSPRRRKALRPEVGLSVLKNK